MLVFPVKWDGIYVELRLVLKSKNFRIFLCLNEFDCRGLNLARQNQIYFCTKKIKKNLTALTYLRLSKSSFSNQKENNYLVWLEAIYPENKLADLYKVSPFSSFPATLNRCNRVLLSNLQTGA